MPFMTRSELGETFQGGLREQFFNLFSLRLLIRDSILPDRYEPSTRMTEAIVLTTPQGVFQLHRYVVGPFGILVSPHSRDMPPNRSIRARCSDVGCPYFHSFALFPGTNRSNSCFLALMNAITHKYVDAKKTEWSEFFNEELGGFPDRFNDLRAENLPVLLANAFSEQELRRLFAHCLGQSSDVLIKELPRRGQLQGLFSGSNDEIADRLDKAQCLQLLLLVNDSELISGLEFLIDNQSINIPPSEIRSSVWTWTNPGNS